MRAPLVGVERYVVPPPCRKGTESAVLLCIAKTHTRGHRKNRSLCVPRLGYHAQTLAHASTARGWPGTRGHARVRAHVNADGHAAQPRKKRARWCGHAALPGHCQRPLVVVNASTSVLVGAEVGMRALVGREGEGTAGRGRAWASSSMVLAWT